MRKTRLTLFKPVQGGEGVFPSVEAQHSYLCHLGETGEGTFLVYQFLLFPLLETILLVLSETEWCWWWQLVGRSDRPRLPSPSVIVFLVNPVSAWPCVRPALTGIKMDLIFKSEM